MIRVKPHPLSESENLKVQEWLNSPSASTVVRIVESKAKTLLAEAIVNVSQGQGGNRKVDMADEKIALAAKYQHFLEVLTELRKNPTFSTITLE